MKIIKLLIGLALGICVLVACEDNCDETVYVTNSDGSSSIECVVYNN